MKHITSPRVKIGSTYDNPKKYVVGLSLEERKKEYPDGVYVLNKDNNVCIMKNGRPQFTKDKEYLKQKSLCSGKGSILLCPEKDCVWHSKSQQCRNRKNASAAIIADDKAQREFYAKTGNVTDTGFTTKRYKSKALKLLNNLVHSYNKEDDVIYIRHAIKKLNKLLTQLEENSTNFDLHSFSLSDYSEESQ